MFQSPYGGIGASDPDNMGVTTWICSGFNHLTVA